ncbi:hypothetical protein EXIGLDRAFT_834016 [Exidia glandulosa HHB12029]|uniref:Uncharacterized protein n=1 Tax=Exidia glandulosa HHB12029 TaxID=1314781 RepID=A0A165K660_EXIGL|nr:hypothetical protein EXIGLDRAFT_834016 [Exidia glandulosa HHB12029]
MWASSLHSLEVFRCNLDDVFFHELVQFAVLTKLCLPFLSDDDFAVMFRNHGSLPSLRSLTFGAGYISFRTFLTLLTRTPELTFLYASLSGLRHPDFASSVNVTLPHLEALKLTVRYDCHDDILGHIFRDGRPHRLASVQLEHITLCRFDIIAGPALLRLTLCNCTVDVDEIAAALQRCPNLEALTLVCVFSGETTASIPEPGILARLRTADVFFHIDGLSGQVAQSTLDPAQIQRFRPFVIALLPPTCSSNICGAFSPNHDRVLSIRLQKSQILSFIPRDGATWHSVKLKISTLSPDYCDVSIHSGEGNVCRSFHADSISECISLMHSHFRIFSRVSSLFVGSETAIQLFSLQNIAFSTLETLVIKFIYPSRSRPDHKPRSVDSLRAVIASAAVVPMESLLLRVIRLKSLQAELLPIVLKGDLLRMFRSEELVEVELPRNST